MEGENAPGPKETEATLEATVNPNYQITTYEFEYATTEALTGATKIPGGSSLPAEFGGQGVSVSTGPHLAKETIYYYRVVAKNGSGSTPGEVKHFVSGPPEQPEAGTAEAVTGTTATLHGVLNPKQEGNPG